MTEIRPEDAIEMLKNLKHVCKIKHLDCDEVVDYAIECIEKVRDMETPKPIKEFVSLNRIAELKGE